MNKENIAKEDAYIALAAHDGFWFAEMLHKENLVLSLNRHILQFKKGDTNAGQPHYSAALGDVDEYEESLEMFPYPKPELSNFSKADYVFIDFTEVETDTWCLVMDGSSFIDAEEYMYTVLDGVTHEPVNLWELLVKWHKDSMLSKKSQKIEFECPHCGHDKLMYVVMMPAKYRVKYIKKRDGKYVWEHDYPDVDDREKLPENGVYVCEKCGAVFPTVANACEGDEAVEEEGDKGWPLHYSPDLVN